MQLNRENGQFVFEYLNRNLELNLNRLPLSGRFDSSCVRSRKAHTTLRRRRIILYNTRSDVVCTDRMPFV